MNTPKAERVFEKAIDTYGPELQQVVAIEELSELQKEISKMIRGKGSIIHLVEEIADVKIMLKQLMMIHEISDKEVNDEIIFKVLRLNEHLNHENE